jgi:hypothetical protein
MARLSRSRALNIHRAGRLDTKAEKFRSTMSQMNSLINAQVLSSCLRNSRAKMMFKTATTTTLND